jgi:ribonuclease P protein subunit POP4
MITPGNILRHELIGLPVEVVQASNPAQQGIAGRLIDETRNMVVIETPRGTKKVQKALATFRLTVPGGTVVDVSGSALVSQPEKRLSKASKMRVNDERRGRSSVAASKTRVEDERRRRSSETKKRF